MQVDQLQRKMIICENDINRTKSNDNYRYPRTPYWGNGGKFNQAQQKQQLSETTMRTPFNGSIPAPSPSNWQNKTPYNGQKFNNFQNFQNARNNRFPQGNFQINGRGFQTGPQQPNQFRNQPVAERPRARICPAHMKFGEMSYVCK